MAEVASSKKYAALLQPNACASDEIRSRFLDSLRSGRKSFGNHSPLVVSIDLWI
ncbi:hypothetical protein L914_14498 [Phytophthora nicotianae]|uniref:Uncharacterized protein n=1 Tax=Phytophthora nicotianae TaxID=4792 RepID=W2MUQ1_PHYNI|nr:hypothetical protein L914_14498 [Phytophthora nicotianae]